MSILRFLFAWANAPYTIAGGIAVGFAVLSGSGILGLFGSAHGDVDADGSADGHAEADSAEHSNVDSNTQEDSHDHEPDAITSAFGIGVLPFSLVWQGGLVVFAATGIALHSRYLADSYVPNRALFWSVPLSIVSSLVVLSVLTRLLGPVFKSRVHEATSRKELVGQDAVVVSTTITKGFGEVQLTDKTGHPLFVVCRLHDSAEQVVREGTRVVFVEEKDGELFVAPLDVPTEDKTLHV